MSRNKGLSVLQKTYDDSYLSCSTAVYHEGQGNELEAMRHWKTALDHIYDHNANKALPLHASRTDTEKALMEALKELELQCKERIDLLEALQASREEHTAAPASAPTSSGKLTKTVESSVSGPSLRGLIGQGTIPAVTYSELSRPTVPQKPTNYRPTLPPRPSSDAAVVGSSSSSNGGNLGNSHLTPVQRVSSNGKGSDNSPTLRSQSPDKYTMRTTLRSGKPNDKTSKGSRKSPKPAAEGPSKAATLAWSALTSRERAARNTPPDTSKSPIHRHSSDQPRQSGTPSLQWDSHSRRLVNPRASDNLGHGVETPTATRHSDDYPRPSYLSVSAASSALNHAPTQDSSSDQGISVSKLERSTVARASPAKLGSRTPRLDPSTAGVVGESSERRRTAQVPIRKKVVSRRASESPQTPAIPTNEISRPRRRERPSLPQASTLSSESGDDITTSTPRSEARKYKLKSDRPEDLGTQSSAESLVGEVKEREETSENALWKKKKESILKNLPPGIDEAAAKQILNDIIVQGDEVRWSDIAGLDIAKNALREAVVYPFLRPDLFMGLREPARGMLLFGPPGTGKTMLARAVATESRSTFFSISASSLTSKFMGESEKLVRALFGLAKLLAPSIIFVDEIDSLLSQRSGSGEHEATRRIKTEFLIQWSDLQRAAAGRETTERDKERGDANRVLVLAATNLPWAIDEAARRRFVRRQYIPLPEATTRETQLRTLLGQQKHHLSGDDISELVELTDGFSGSDITALAKDAAMGPLRSLGEALLHMTMDDIRPIMLLDFQASLGAIRPSVSKTGLQQYETWAKEFGERGG